MRPGPYLLEQSHVVALPRRRGATGTCRLGVALLSAAVALAGVVALLLPGRGVVPALVRPAAVPLPRSLSGQSFSRRVSEGTWKKRRERRSLMECKGTVSLSSTNTIYRPIDGNPKNFAMASYLPVHTHGPIGSNLAFSVSPSRTKNGLGWI